jgi:TRAP-type mannitol/chloroaromatic compound transport system permease small subunit
MTQPPPGSYPPPPPPAGGGYPPPGGAPAPQPSNHLAIAILVTLFCCLPFGIMSIIKSTQVSGLWTSGQYAEAQASADSAKKWAIWGVVAGVVVAIIYGILIAVGALSTDFSTTTTS